jgi:nitroreductase
LRVYIAPLPLLQIVAGKVFVMDVLEAIRTRRSIRKFRPKPIPDEKLKTILEAGRLAPSAGNRQPWFFVVVKDPERKKALAMAAGNQTFIADAGVIIVALGDPEASPRWFRQDPMIAVEHMVLAATGLGYGTCWIGAFDEEEVKRLLRVPNELTVIGLLPIGFPNESPLSRPRKPLKEIFFLDECGKPFQT